MWSAIVLGTAVVSGLLAGPGAATTGGDGDTAGVEVRVWQNVEDGRGIYVSARPTGGSWRTLGTIPLPLDDGFSSGGRYRYGDIALDVAVENRLPPTTVEVRVWQDVRDARTIWISARASHGSWRTLGTIPLPLDDGLSSNRQYRYGDIGIAVPLPDVAVTTLLDLGWAGSPRYTHLATDHDGSVVIAGGGAAHRISLADGAITNARAGVSANALAGVDVDIAPDGTIYVAADQGRLIRKITPDGTVRTVARRGSTGHAPADDGDGPALKARLDLVKALVIDNYGDIFMIDHQRVRRLSPSGEGEISTIAGSAHSGAGLKDGPGHQALFGNMTAIDVDDQGNIYILEHHQLSWGNGPEVAVRMITESGVVSTLFRGEHLSFGGVLGPSSGIAVTGDGSSIYIANTGQNQIVELTRDGKILAVAGTGEAGYADGPPSEALFNLPKDIALSEDGRTLVVVDRNGTLVRQVDLTRAASRGRPPLAAVEATPRLEGVQYQVFARLPNMKLNVITPAPGNAIVASLSGNKGIVRIVPGDSNEDPAVTVLTGNGPGYQDGPCESAQFNSIKELAVDGDGSIWVLERESNYRIRRITWTPAAESTAPDCSVATIATLTPYTSGHIAVDGQGNLLISSGGIHRISPDGTVSTLLRGDFRGLASANGAVYVAEPDWAAGTVPIKQIDANNRTSTLWTGRQGLYGGLLSMQGLAIGAAADGTIYAWSGSYRRIVRISPDGSASIVYEGTTRLRGLGGSINQPPSVTPDGALLLNTYNRDDRAQEIWKVTFESEGTD